MAIEIIGGFESTYLPAHDRDVLETTRHDARRASDLALLRGLGITRARYPIRWHRVEREPGTYDWADADAAMAALDDAGIAPILDLVHHTSYPQWLERGFADPRFPDAYVAWCTAVARRYPAVREYTLFNEPFSTLFLAGHEGIWPPYERGMPGFVALLRNVLPAIGEASRRVAALLPDARHVWVDTCERHTSDGSRSGGAYASYANDRRFFVLDALLGGAGDLDRPFVADVLAFGGEDLLELEPARVDVVGLDYYAHSQWHFTARGGETPSPEPAPLASLIVEYAERYGRPLALTETNIRGFASDRATWLKHTLEQCEIALEAGVQVEGYCWFPVVDSCDWDSLLYRCDGNVDPVGVWWLDAELERRASSMASAYALAAGGAPARDLPAYRLRRPVADWLQGFLPQMRGWRWDDPPDEPCSQTAPPDDRIEFRIRDAA